MSEADTSKPDTGDGGASASSTPAAAERAADAAQQDAMPTVPVEGIDRQEPEAQTATPTRELRDEELFDVIAAPENNRVDDELLPSARVRSYQPNFTGNYPSSGYASRSASQGSHRAPGALVRVDKPTPQPEKDAISVSPISFAALMTGSISIVVTWVGLIVFPPFFLLGTVGCVAAIVLGILGVALEPKGKPFSISGLSLGSLGCLGTFVVVALVTFAFVFLLWLTTVLSTVSAS